MPTIWKILWVWFKLTLLIWAMALPEWVLLAVITVGIGYFNPACWITAGLALAVGASIPAYMIWALRPKSRYVPG